MKITVEQAMERYPLRVYFPMPGEYRLLIIHTENEQQQFLLAKSEEGLRRLLQVFIKRERFAPTVRELWHIEMVSPPQQIKEKYAQSKYDWEFSMFRRTLGSAAEDFLKNNLPAPMRPCKKYVPDMEQLGSEIIDDSDRKYHICCKTCDGIKVVFYTDVEELFLKKYDLYEKLAGVGRPPPSKLVKKTITPRALDPLAKDPDLDRTIYIATPHYGPHSSGNVIEELKKDYISTDGFPLFFFQGEKLCSVPPWAKALVDEQRDLRKRDDELYRKQAAENHKKYQEERLSILKELFA